MGFFCAFEEKLCMQNLICSPGAFLHHLNMRAMEEQHASAAGTCTHRRTATGLMSVPSTGSSVKEQAHGGREPRRDLNVGDYSRHMSWGGK